ncbi:MAG: hypothetical protein J5699_06235 [Bacteroidales bacterium]|nr:hypothetical protein [Bacteroidales bacterium]
MKTRKVFIAIALLGVMVLAASCVKGSEPDGVKAIRDSTAAYYTDLSN